MHIHLEPNTCTVDSLTRACVRILGLSIAAFAAWTFAVHMAVLFGLSWNVLRIFGGLGILASPWLARKLFGAWLEGFRDHRPVAKSLLPSSVSTPVLLLLIAAAVCMIIAADYPTRYSIALLFSCGLFALLRWKTPRIEPVDETSHPEATWIDYLWLSVLCLGSVVLVQSLHRTDLDDCSYLQLAASTQRNATLPVFGFDESLGELRQGFRFIPYKLSSYELLSSLFSDCFALSLEHAYYILIPILTTIAGILAMFLFGRLFLPVRGALCASALFILLILAWGDSSLAFGNRLFVRLFQGKALLIYLEAPLLFLTSVFLIKRPGPQTAFASSAILIAGIGASSTGLSCGLLGAAASMLPPALVYGFPQRNKRLWLLVPFVYPLLAGALLWIAIPKGVHFSEIGTPAPIHSSIGNGIRQSTVLLLVLGSVIFAFLGSTARLLSWMAVVSVFVLFCPWFSGFLASASAANFSWRMGWIAPVAPLLSVIVTVSLLVVPKGRWQAWMPSCIILVFLFGGKSVFSSDNRVIWGAAKPTIDANYYLTKELLNKLPKSETKAVLLAEDSIAAWIPLAGPGTPLVMAGHTYPIMLATMLQKEELEERLWLFRAIFNEVPRHASDRIRFGSLVRKYHVNTLVYRSGRSGPESWIDLLKSQDFRICSEDQYSGYEILRFDCEGKGQ